jgi:ribonuclease PH
MTCTAKEKIIVALDAPDMASALRLVDNLDDAISWVKVGLQLFTAEGPPIVLAMKERRLKVFLDLKFHDIPNTAREAVRGKQSGRTMEIQRLIGRSLRGVMDLGIIGERTIAVDCDVLQADGGTRTASVTGAYVAVYQVALKIKDLLGLHELPLFDSIAAVSAGIVEGETRLDLDYEEDSSAEVDLNAVITGDGRLVEVQATAEGEPYSRAALDAMLDLVTAGARSLAAAQTAACAELEQA